MPKNSKCIECQKEIVAGANVCVSCGSFQNWRRHIKTWTPLLGFVLAFIAFMSSIAPQLRNTFAPSDPKISLHIQEVTERSVTLQMSNLGERQIVINPLLRCVSGDRIEEAVVDYEEPFRVRFSTIEGLSALPTSLPEYGGGASVTFEIAEFIEGSWLATDPVFLLPEDPRVRDIEKRFSLGFRQTWFGADDKNAIPVFHIVGLDELISLLPVKWLVTFCEVTAVDPRTSKEVREAFAFWPIGNGYWEAGEASTMFGVLGSLIHMNSHGLNETDPNICNVDNPPGWCIRSLP